jgi:hypothetical protein
MAQNPEAINETLTALVDPQTHGRLLARGLARGMVWRDGVVPEGAQDFSTSLTPDLLIWLRYFALALNSGMQTEIASPISGLIRMNPCSCEAIESAVRHGDPLNGDQGGI